MGYREVEQPQVDIKWDQPKVFEGIYRGGKETKTKYGLNTLHTIDIVGVGSQTFFGTHQLNERLADVPHGSQIRIEYTGKQTKTSGGNLVKEFKVGVWEDEGEGEVGTSAPAPPVHHETPPQPTPVGATPPPRAPTPPATGAPAKTLPPLPPNVENMKAQCREYIAVLKLSKEDAAMLWRSLGSEAETHEDWKRCFVALYSMNNGMPKGQAILAALQAFPKEQDGQDDVPF